MCITDIAQEIYLDELAEPDDVSVPAIAHWLQVKIGNLNNLLDTTFSYSAGDNSFSPELNSVEVDIYKKMYVVDYIGRQIKKYTGAGAYDSEQVIEFKEGNRTTKLNPKTNNSKIFLEYQKELKSDLLLAIHAYKMNLSDPRQSIIPEDGCCDGFGESEFWRTRY